MDPNLRLFRISQPKTRGEWFQGEWPDEIFYSSNGHKGRVEYERNTYKFRTSFEVPGCNSYFCDWIKNLQPQRMWLFQQKNAHMLNVSRTGLFCKIIGWIIRQRLLQTRRQPWWLIKSWNTAPKDAGHETQYYPHSDRSTRSDKQKNSHYYTEN